MPTPLVRFLKSVIVVLVPVWLVLGSVQLLVTNRYLALEYSRADFPHDHSAFNFKQHLTYAEANFQYVRDRLGHEALATQRLGNGPLYNEREIQHMHDVQSVYQTAGLVWKVAGVLLVLSALILAWRVPGRATLASAIKWGGLMAAGVVAALALFATIAWQVWFVAFHEVFFAPGTWTFSYSDTLIRLFPEKFWFNTALTLSGLTLVAGLAMAVAGWVLETPERPSALPFSNFQA
jgi:integral membrane protein (TIGR01906 family)